MTQIKDYSDLNVWKKGVELSGKVYKVTASFPYHEQKGLTSQFRRASTSISLNIAEGFERKSGKDYMRFLKISKGSAAECRTLALICKQAGYISNEESKELENEFISVAKMLNALITAIKRAESRKAAGN